MNIFKSKPVTQEGKILNLLRKNNGVANYEFSKHHILSHTKIISNLRQEGYNITKERVQLPNGRYSGVYKYYLEETE